MTHNTAHRGVWDILSLVFTLYRIDCRGNGKSYIGVTGGTIHARWKQHVKRALSGRPDGSAVLHRCIRLYGKDAFSIEVIDVVEGMLCAQGRERELILANDTLVPRGMNMTTGGELLVGIVRSEEVRENHGNIMRGRKHSPEHRAAISAGLKGGTQSAESNAKRSAAMKGRKPAPQAVEASVSARIGKPLTPEHVAKVVAKKIGAKPSRETCDRISAARKLNPLIFTDEIIAKMSTPRVKTLALSKQEQARLAKRRAEAKARRDRRLMDGLPAQEPAA